MGAACFNYIDISDIITREHTKTPITLEFILVMPPTW